MGRSSFRNGKVTPVKRKATSRRLAKLSWLALASTSIVVRTASADVTIWKSEKGEGGWEVFTNGRVAGFASWVRGDGSPQPLFDQSKIPYVKLHDLKADVGVLDSN